MSNKIRVLHIIKTLNISGAERFGVELALHLDPKFYEVRVCAFFQENEPIEKHWFERLNERGVITWFATPWAGLNNFGRYVKGVRALECHLQSWPAEIIHTHFQLGTLAALYCKVKKLTKRVVRTAQNHTRKEWSPGLYGWLRYMLLSGWIYPMACDAEVGVSKAIVEELRSKPGSRFAPRPPELITNAIPTNLVELAEAIPRTNRGAGRYVIGSIGRLMRQKGYSYLLKALPEVYAELPEAELWLIGDGELKPELEKLALELGISTRVKFLGRQTNVFPWLRQMDLFVLPSLWEGFALVIMESMAAGTPVLATDIEGTREMITSGQNGWLVPPAEPSDLAKAMIYILKDSDLREKIVINAFASLDAVKFDKVAAHYDKLYRDLLQQGSYTG